MSREKRGTDSRQHSKAGRYWLDISTQERLTGVSPCDTMSYMKTFTLRTDKDFEALRKIAKKSGLSVAWLMKDAIKTWLRSPRRKEIEKLQRGDL